MPKILKAKNMNKCIGCFSCMNICAAVNKQNHCLLKSAIRIRTSGGLSGRFVSTVCVGCTDERACMEVCPSGALSKRPGGGVILDAAKCIGCRRCQQACIVSAVGFDNETKTPIICKHCGMCARYCPHECLIMQEVPNDL